MTKEEMNMNLKDCIDDLMREMEIALADNIDSFTNENLYGEITELMNEVMKDYIKYAIDNPQVNQAKKILNNPLITISIEDEQQLKTLLK